MMSGTLGYLRGPPAFQRDMRVGGKGVTVKRSRVTRYNYWEVGLRGVTIKGSRITGIDMVKNQLGLGAIDMVRNHVVMLRSFPS